MNEIEKLRTNLNKYPNIYSLIDEKDISKWLEKLSEFDNPITQYVKSSNYNILTVLITAEINLDSDKLLKQLEDGLNTFPDLKSSDTFKRNIKSLDNFAFFSFLSELSLSK